MGAINRPDLLEQSLLRPGQPDKLVDVGLYCGAEEKTSVLSALCRELHLHEEVDLSGVAAALPERCTETINTHTIDPRDSPPSKTANLAHDKTGRNGDNIEMSFTHTKTKNNGPDANLKSTSAAVPTWTTFKKNYPMAVSEHFQFKDSPPLKRAKLAHDKTDMNEDNIDANRISTSTAIPAWTTFEKNNPMAVLEHFHFTDYPPLKRAKLEKDNIKVSEQFQNDIFDTASKNLKTHLNDTHNQSDKMAQYGSNCKNKNKSKGSGKYEYQIAIKIEKAVAVCISSDPDKYTKSLKEAVNELNKHSAMSQLASGFYAYLNKTERKKEFVPEYKNRNDQLKPTPTKYVESLMDIIHMIDINGLKLWECVLNICRYMLFRLDEGATKQLDIVESVTHLFVNMCQYDERRNSKHIILFMLAAMYCANNITLTIIKICLDLVPEILPHECQKENTLYSTNPILQIFAFLLHFYNCKDEHNKVQHLRDTLKIRYGYDPTQENLQTILSKVTQTVLEMNDHYLDNTMLQYCILSLAKQNGSQWCQENIVKNIILPILEGKIYASEATFQFSAKIITKLIKPYTKEMKIHSEEVANLLLGIIHKQHPQEIKDEIMCGLLYLNMENVNLNISGYLENSDPRSMSLKLIKTLNKYLKKTLQQLIAKHIKTDV